MGRQFGEIVGINGNALYACLVDNGRGHLEHVRRVAAVARAVVARQVAVHDGASPVHGCHGVAAERVHCQLETFALGVVLLEEDVLRCKHGLARHVVREHALPTARQCATVEDHLQPVVVGVAQYVLVELHDVLLVTPEEVYLYAFYSDRLHPSHLSLTGDGGVHAVARCQRSLVGCAIAVVPEHQAYAFLLCVSAQFGNALTPRLLVP